MATALGMGFTVPLTGRSWEAGADTCVIFPAGVPVAAAERRTKMEVLETVPPEGISVTLGPNPEPLVVEISKPAGAVITISVSRLVPDTE